MKKINYFVKTKVGIAVVGIILLVLVFLMFNIFGNGNSNIEAFVVEKRNVSEEISVSGTVEAATDVDLSLERSGQINTIAKKVGDDVEKGSVILSLENSSQYAQLAQAEADLNIERIKLQELSGNSVSGITTSQNDLKLAEINFDNAEDNLRREIREAIIESNDAIKNYSDRLFEDGGFGATLISGSVRYSVNTGDSARKITVNNGRSKVKIIFEKNWENLDIENNPEESAEKILNDFSVIQNFLDDLADLVNDLSEPEDSTIKTAFNSLRDNVSTARTKINTALSELKSSLQTYNIEKTDLEYVSSQTSLTGEDTRLQEARVESAKAKVATELAVLNQGIIRSPVHGKVTSIKTKIGEVVSANTPVVTIVSDALYEVTINIPEANVSKVSIGNTAQITLDAYSDSDIFSGKVISIDLSETIIDGVTTYEAKLQFEAKDDRIRSGMTANVEIFGESRDNVLAVPQKAITLKDGKRIVRTLENQKEKEVEVEIGLRGTDGFIEIISGLKEGQVVLTS